MIATFILSDIFVGVGYLTREEWVLGDFEEPRAITEMTNWAQGAESTGAFHTVRNPFPSCSL